MKLRCSLGVDTWVNRTSPLFHLRLLARWTLRVCAACALSDCAVTSSSALVAQDWACASLTSAPRNGSASIQLGSRNLGPRASCAVRIARTAVAGTISVGPLSTPTAAPPSAVTIKGFFADETQLWEPTRRRHVCRGWVVHRGTPFSTIESNESALLRRTDRRGTRHTSVGLHVSSSSPQLAFGGWYWSEWVEGRSDGLRGSFAGTPHDSVQYSVQRVSQTSIQFGTHRLYRHQAECQRSAPTTRTELTEYPTGPEER